jgi:hypothetical protein
MMSAFILFITGLLILSVLFAVPQAFSVLFFLLIGTVILSAVGVWFDGFES